MSKILKHNEPVWRISIDTGGTFTDCIGLSPSGQLGVVKVLSSGRLTGTIDKSAGKGAFFISHSWPVKRDILKGYQFSVPGTQIQGKIGSFDPDKSLLKTNVPLKLKKNTFFEITAGEEAPVLGVRLITGTGIHEPLPPVELRLGTTKGTNALLERKGSGTTLFITQGFKDLLYIGTQQRPDLFQLAIPEPALFYVQVIEVKERMGSDGKSLIYPDLKDLDLNGSNLTASTAIAFLNSYSNPSHEQDLKSKLESAGIKNISISSELSSSIKFLPRANTAVINAYLQPVLDTYLKGIIDSVKPRSFMIMNSSGGLYPSSQFHAKDSLLSGPAGGVMGARSIAQQFGFQKIIAFDMGGTSTDVSRIDETVDLRFNIQIDQLELSLPALDIHTVAAGGGSVCKYDGYHLTVGPESAGADPGPACYGKGGPLTITDVNVLLGKLPKEALPIPVFPDKATKALKDVQSDLQNAGNHVNELDLIKSFERIANEKMAAAIRKISVNKGFDPTDHVLVVYGGAGGLHACKMATLLHIKKVIFPYLGGVLSAHGIFHASLEETADHYILEPLARIDSIEKIVTSVQREAILKLSEKISEKETPEIKYTALFVRISGQEHALEIPYQKGMNIEKTFEEAYQKLYGYHMNGPDLELVHVISTAAQLSNPVLSIRLPRNSVYNQSLVGGIVDNQKPVVYIWKDLEQGTLISGPAIVLQDYCTVFIEPYWKARVTSQHHLFAEAPERLPEQQKVIPETAEKELFINRFQNIADEMGEQLKRTAHSVNVKERLDFSCAMLDSDARLVVNAPHIPVHLGSLGVAAREMMKKLPIGPGDVIICNHPRYGGSHLNDITLLSGVFSGDNRLIGHLINRAHHAEIGGKTPGSMPIHAVQLPEEGVVIPPMYLIRDGKEKWKDLEQVFSQAPFPTRSLESNLADIRAGLASLEKGRKDLQLLETIYGIDKLKLHMASIQNRSKETVLQAIKKWKGRPIDVEERLDDRSLIKLSIRIGENEILFDFHGTSGIHPGNLNAGHAIVHSTIIYVLRLLCPPDIPLNEGLIEPVSIRLEPCFLAPYFPEDTMKSPAVAAGNTEVSQRLADTLLKAFGLCACSQGTMNNLLFGGPEFGYYETIGGGVGAVEGYHGRSAIHQHMTNTRITDPEELEWRYPVRLARFEIRRNSGGRGKWNGGDGIIREFLFLKDLEVTFIGEHRKETPYGMKGGEPGKPGKQRWIKSNGDTQELPGIFNIHARPGDRLVIETPGGGGWGDPTLSIHSNEQGKAGV